MRSFLIVFLLLVSPVSAETLEQNTEPLYAKVETLLDSGSYQEARNTATTLVAIQRRRLADDDPDLGYALFLQGSALFHLNASPEELAEILQAAWDILEPALGSNHELTLAVADFLSNVRIRMLQRDNSDPAIWSAARPVFEAAWVDRIARFGAIDSHTADIVFWLAYAAQRTGDGGFAIALAEDLVASTSRADIKLRFFAYHLLGGIRFEIGEFETATNALTQARIFADEAGFPNYGMTVENLQLLAHAQLYAGRIDEANEASSYALAILLDTQVLDAEPELIPIAIKLVQLSGHVGNPSRAALGVGWLASYIEAKYGNEDLRLADLLLVYGDIAGIADDTQERITAFRRAATLLEGHPQARAAALALVNCRLGGLALDIGLDDEARVRIASALSAARTQHAPEPLICALGVGAGLSLYDGSVEAAKAMLLEAHGLIGADEPYLLATLSGIEAGLGNAPLARDYMERAMTAADRLGPLVQAQIAEIQWGFAGEQDSLPILADAATRMNHFAATIVPTMPIAQQTAFTEFTLTRNTMMLIRAWAQYPEVSRLYPHIAIRKGLLTRSLRALGVTATTPEAAAHLEQLHAARSALSHAIRAGLPDERVRELTANKEGLERFVLLHRPFDAAIVAVDDHYSFNMPSGEVFFDFYQSFQDTLMYFAVVVTHGEAPRLVPMGAASDIDATIARWRNAVTAGAAAVLETDALVKAVWAPLAEFIPPETHRVWISPESHLARIPWNFVVKQGPTTAHVRVHEVSGMEELTRLTSGSDVTGPLESAFVVGGVAFGEGGGWSFLEGSVQEAQRIHALLDHQGINTTSVLGEEATPARLIQLLSSTQIAHIATHGYFSSEDSALSNSRGMRLTASSVSAPTLPPPRNPLSESGLALAGANRDPEGNLSAEQFVGLDLSEIRLLVLSACDTGRGIEVGGQGVLGLRASLAAAGVQSLILSLWKVPDDSTAMLMEHFYRAMVGEGLSIAEALSRAQSEVRNTPGYNTPHHWAAWVLVGGG